MSDIKSKNIRSNTDKYTAIAKSAVLIMVCTIVLKLLGFLREFALAYFWGTSGITDAFLISQTIPGTLFEFASVGIATCYIPVFYEVVKNHGSELSFTFTNRITTILFAFSTALVVAVWLFTPFFVNLFATGFSGETLRLACWFTRISIISIYFSSLTGVFNSFLQAKYSFAPNAVLTVLQNLLILVSIYIGTVYGVWWMCIGCALSIGIRALLLWPFVSKHNYRLRLDFKWHDPYIKKFFILLLPVIFGVAVNDLNTIFDRTIASQVAVGAISALTYGNSLIQLANGGVVQPIATVYYPYITKYISEGRKDDSIKMLRLTISVTIVLFLPITLFFLVFSEQITTVLFGRGAFDADSISMTSTAFFFYSVGLCFIAIREVLSRYYYANGNTKTPMYNAAIGVIFNIILNFLLSKYLGVGGLALATSISALVTSVLLIYDARRKLDLRIKDLFDAIELGKAIIATLIMGIITISLYNWLGVTLILRLAIVIITSIIAFVFFTYVLKMNIAIMALQWVKNKIKIYKKNESINP